MKTTYTQFTISPVETPSGQKIPVRGKAEEIIRLDVETFPKGNIARLVLWTKEGVSHSLLFQAQIMCGTSDPNATKREDI